MDLSKAFDCLPYSLLISKLHAYGLTLPACKLVASYLSNRSQRVKLGDARSNWAKLTKGVPRGSILGPLLFNVFTNDLFYFMENCTWYNYADDNSISKASPSLDTVLSSLTYDGNNAVQWFDTNGMQANPEKFQFMMLSRIPLKEQCITLGQDTVLSSEACVKVLGVMIDENLISPDMLVHYVTKRPDNWMHCRAYQYILKNLPEKSYIIASLWAISLIVLLCGISVVKLTMEKLKK